MTARLDLSMPSSEAKGRIEGSVLSMRSSQTRAELKGVLARLVSLPETLPVYSRWIVHDLVYNPQETRLLARLRAARARAVGGLGMLVYQGALAFELWTGRKAPIEVMRAPAGKAHQPRAQRGVASADA